MVVGFTTTYAISTYRHYCCEFESRSGQGVQYYVKKFVSDLRQVVVSSNKTDRHDIAEILLKVVLNTIKQTNKHDATFHEMSVYFLVVSFIDGGIWSNGQKSLTCCK
jgi:hypothetical protein